MGQGAAVQLLAVEIAETVRCNVEYYPRVTLTSSLDTGGFSCTCS